MNSAVQRKKNDQETDTLETLLATSKTGRIINHTDELEHPIHYRLWCPNSYDDGQFTLWNQITITKLKECF